MLDTSISLSREEWLRASIERLRSTTRELSAAESSDDVMRRCVELARDKFGFKRIGCWFFAEQPDLLNGSFGIDENGALSDERAFRVYDRTNGLAQMIAAWDQAPHYYFSRDQALRTGESRLVGNGVHITVPLMRGGAYRGFISVDDLLGPSRLDEYSGRFLTLYATIVSCQYYAKRSEDDAARAREAAASAERVKTEFLEVMSHEIRTPLNAIMGFAQLLCAESNSPSTQSLVRTIEENGDHLSELIGGMLEYAQTSEVCDVDSFGSCDPVSIVSSSVAAFTQVYRQKGISLAYVSEGDEVGYVKADGLALRQVMTHLLQNALKFTHEGEVRVGVQTRAKSDSQAECFFTVEDTGIGIEPNDIPHIFEPLRQVDSSRTRSAGGVGMGLAIVDRLVRSLGGHLECRSVVGEGSRFALHFVFERTAQVELQPSVILPAATPIHKPKSALRFLVVEEQESNLQVLVSMLSHLGYPVPDAAFSTRSARESLQKRPYDLVALNVEMSDEDGLKLARAIRSGDCGPVNKNAAIIGIAAFSRQLDYVQCISAGMDGCVSKPIKLGELDRTLFNALAGEKG